MSDLMLVDAWLHNVFNTKIPLEELATRFDEFSLQGDVFILNEIQNSMIPIAQERGWLDKIKKYNQIVSVLEKCIEKKK